MRDIILFILIFGSLPLIIARPWIGILVWSFIGYMNPHRLCWGPAYNFPFAAVVAATLLASILVGKQKMRMDITPLVVVWMVLIAWMIITTVFSIHPVGAWNQLDKVLKIQLVTFLSIMLITDRYRLFLLLCVVTISIGFFGFKGGIFTIINGGSFRVWGPPGSFIDDNNHLAVGLLMTIPLIFYVANQVKSPFIRLGILATTLPCFFSVFGSQSRGALLATIAMSTFLVLKSKQKILAGISVLILIPFIISFMPQSWHDRMNTIKEYEQDGSAMGRLNAWQYSINLANDRVTGGGFESWSASTFAVWAPVPDDVHAAHSIYFGILGDHGWLGLALFLSVYTIAWIRLTRVVKQAEPIPDLKWMVDLGRMLKVSFVAYFVGGAFLSLAYFDLPWHMVSIVCIIETMQRKYLKDPSANAHLVESKPTMFLGKFRTA